MDIESTFNDCIYLIYNESVISILRLKNVISTLKMNKQIA